MWAGDYSVEEPRSDVTVEEPRGEATVAAREKIVRFGTGATRSAETAYDPSGFISPRVLQVFSEYMERHRLQADGTLRASNNWVKGMPTSRTIRSTIRHVMDLWLIYCGFPPKSHDCRNALDALCAIYFNIGRLILNYDSGQHHEEDSADPRGNHE